MKGFEESARLKQCRKGANAIAEMLSDDARNSLGVGGRKGEGRGCTTHVCRLYGSMGDTEPQRQTSQKLLKGPRCSLQMTCLDVARLKFPLYVSQDGAIPNSKVEQLAQSLTGRGVSYLHHREQKAPIPLLNRRENLAYYRISNHYKFIMRTFFDCLGYSKLIILEVPYPLPPLLPSNCIPSLFRRPHSCNLSCISMGEIDAISTKFRDSQESTDSWGI
jgi:hypothetical protein